MAPASAQLFYPDVRLRLVGSRPFFGPGTAMLLRAIQQCGCITGACEQIGISYSKGRSILQAAEQELGFSLVHRSKGGSGGGKASLTPYGLELLDHYEQFQQKVILYASEAFNPLCSILEKIK